MSFAFAAASRSPISRSTTGLRNRYFYQTPAAAHVFWRARRGGRQTACYAGRDGVRRRAALEPALARGSRRGPVRRPLPQALRRPARRAPGAAVRGGADRRHRRQRSLRRACAPAPAALRDRPPDPRTPRALRRGPPARPGRLVAAHAPARDAGPAGPTAPAGDRSALALRPVVRGREALRGDRQPRPALPPNRELRRLPPSYRTFGKALVARRRRELARVQPTRPGSAAAAAAAQVACGTLAGSGE